MAAMIGRLFQIEGKILSQNGLRQGLKGDFGNTLAWGIGGAAVFEGAGAYIASKFARHSGKAAEAGKAIDTVV